MRRPGVQERRSSREQQGAEEAPAGEGIGQARLIYGVAAEYDRHSRVNVRFHSEEHRASGATERYAEGIDTRWVKVRNPVPVHIDADLNHTHKLHQIHSHLAPTVANEEDGARSGSEAVFLRFEYPVPVDIHSPPPRRQSDACVSSRHPEIP